MDRIKKDLTGIRFGKLVCVGFHDFIKGKSHWLYKCDCGRTIIARGSSVTAGHRNSCGCLNHKFTKHKMTGTHFYKKRSSLLQRCNNKNEKCYNDYGGRGICCMWKDFEDFMSDMYMSYLEHIKEHGEKQTTLDRIDVNGNYCKENCKWSTWKEQSNNKRNNINIRYNGETHTLEQWKNILLKHAI